MKYLFFLYFFAIVGCKGNHNKSALQIDTLRIVKKDTSIAKKDTIAKVPDPYKVLDSQLYYFGRQLDFHEMGDYFADRYYQTGLEKYRRSGNYCYDSAHYYWLLQLQLLIKNGLYKPGMSNQSANHLYNQKIK